MDGWIKLHRKILDWEWFDDSNTFHVFMYLLLRANITDSSFHGVTIPRGTVVSSIRSISVATGLTEKQVRNSLNHLKKTGEIAVKGHPKFGVYSIKNYDLYQTEGQANGQSTGQSKGSQGAAKGQSKGSQRATLKEEEEEKEEKEPKKERSYYPGDAALDEAFRSFVEMRIKIKQPMTDRAIDLAMARLKRMASDPSGTMDNDLAIRILEQSVRNNWRDIYELKEEKNSTKTAGQMDLTAEWRKYI